MSTTLTAPAESGLNTSKKSKLKANGIVCIGMDSDYCDAGHDSSETAKAKLKEVFESGYFSTRSVRGGIDAVLAKFSNVQPLWLYRHSGEHFETKQSCQWDSGFYGFLCGTKIQREMELEEANYALSGEDDE